MQNSQPVVVLFPGAWGNKTLELVQWWFHYLIEFFKEQGFRVVLITYTGRTLDEYVDNALIQLDEARVPDGSFAVCYSMGAQIARGVQHRRNGQLFRKVILAGGLENRGVSLRTFVQGLRVAWWPLIRGLFTGFVMFTNRKQVWHIMCSALPGLESAAHEMRQHMAPEPTRVILALAFPGLRQRMPPFRCPVLALVGARDFFVANAEYAGERPCLVPAVEQPHAFIRSRRIVEWFDGATAYGFDWLTEL